MRQPLTARSGLCLLVAISLIACADNQAIRLRYEVEQFYYEAGRILRDVGSKPDSARQDDMSRAAELYGRAFTLSVAALDSVDAKKHPVERRELQYLAFQSASRQSQLYSYARQYDTCVTILGGLVSRVPLDRAQAMTARFNLGQALQMAGRWDSALTTYDSVLAQNDPPLDDSGRVVVNLMNLRLHLYRVVRTVGDSLAAARQYRLAERYYSALIENYPAASPTHRAARENLARLYDAAGEWEQAITQLSLLAQPRSADYQRLLITMADILNSRGRLLDSAQALYQKVLTGVSQVDTVLAPELQFKLAQLLMQQGRYDEAREILIDLKRQYPNYYDTTPAAQEAISRSFELQNNWGRAEIEYKFLMEKYRGTEPALEAYLHLAEHYELEKRTTEAERWYGEAEEAFQQLATRGQGTEQEALALSYQAQLLQRRSHWLEAVEVLKAAFDKFPDSEIGDRSALQAAAICRERLDRPAEADTLAQRLRASMAHVENWNE